MDIEEKLNLIIRNTEEIVTLKQLRDLLESNSEPRAYWGFECSGLMHIGIGLLPGMKIRNMIKAGFKFVIFLADWHSWINNKLGGEMAAIHASGEYFKHCFRALSVPSDKTQYIWASDIANDIGYWEKVLRIAKHSSLKRVFRALTIMGREMDVSNIETAWILYPLMQAADIFQMDIQVACGGIDQRKAHMLARESARKLGYPKPIAIHTPLLSGLRLIEGERKGHFDEDVEIDHRIRSKMSKSKPDTCIFIHDSPKEIMLKMKAAYCPPKQEKENPVLEYAKHIIFAERPSLDINRPNKYGGSLSYDSYQSLRNAYVKGEIHPSDLKTAIAEAITDILEPVRQYFRRNPKPLEKIRQYDVIN